MPLLATTIRNFTDNEYLHYAAHGLIPGVNPRDPVVSDCLSVGMCGYEDARRTLVLEKQHHDNNLDACLAALALDSDE